MESFKIETNCIKAEEETSLKVNRNVQQCCGSSVTKLITIVTFSCEMLVKILSLLRGTFNWEFFSSLNF